MSELRSGAAVDEAVVDHLRAPARLRVLVTGSSRGIGLGVARRFVEAGATVVLHGRDEARLAAAAASLSALGAAVHTVRGVLEQPGAMDRIRDETLAAVGVPDVVVANAGSSTVRPGPVEDLSPDTWSEAIDANLTATFLTVRAFLPLMKRRGSGCLITVSSTATRIADPQSPPAYTAAKAAIEMLTRTVAVQAGPSGVRANCVAPATVLTETNAELLPPAVREQIAHRYPLGRLGTVDDVADAVLYLSTATWVTGATLDVAGGSAPT